MAKMNLKFEEHLFINSGFNMPITLGNVSDSLEAVCRIICVRYQCKFHKQVSS